MWKYVQIHQDKNEKNENQSDFARANLFGNRRPTNEKIPIATDENGEISTAEEKHGQQRRGERRHPGVELFVAMGEKSVAIDCVWMTKIGQ